MSNGNDKIVDVLKSYYLRTAEARGSVLPTAFSRYLHLKRNGFNVEYGDKDPRYNFIYIPGYKFTTEFVLNTFTKLEKCGIIVSVTRGSKARSIAKQANEIGLRVKYYAYSLDNGFILAVLFYNGRKDEYQLKRDF